MINEKAIEAIQKSQATEASNEAITAALTTDSAVAALPNDFVLHDLEKFKPYRSRLVGVMKTPNITHFVAYTEQHKQAGTSIFIDDAYMTAFAVLDLGTNEMPGHAGNTAVLMCKKTAAFTALCSATQSPKLQSQAAEFIEDWQDLIVCTDQQGKAIPVAHAIEAMRTLTIEYAKKLETNVADFEESSSVADSVRASAKQALPARITFKAVPYIDLSAREFSVRVGIQTGEAKPKIVFRIIKEEDHCQAMAEELAKLIKDRVKDDIRTYIGNYAKASK